MAEKYKNSLDILLHGVIQYRRRHCCFLFCLLIFCFSDQPHRCSDKNVAKSVHQSQFIFAYVLESELPFISSFFLFSYSLSFDFVSYSFCVCFFLCRKPLFVVFIKTNGNRRTGAEQLNFFFFVVAVSSSELHSKLMLGDLQCDLSMFIIFNWKKMCVFAIRRKYHTSTHERNTFGEFLNDTMQIGATLSIQFNWVSLEYFTLASKIRVWLSSWRYLLKIFALSKTRAINRLLISFHGEFYCILKQRPLVITNQRNIFTERAPTTRDHFNDFFSTIANVFFLSTNTFFSFLKVKTTNVAP